MGTYRSNRKISITNPIVDSVSVNGVATDNWVVIKIATDFYLVVDNVLSSDTIAYS